LVNRAAVNNTNRLDTAAADDDDATSRRQGALLSLDPTMSSVEMRIPLVHRCTKDVGHLGVEPSSTACTRIRAAYDHQRCMFSSGEVLAQKTEHIHRFMSLAVQSKH